MSSEEKSYTIKPSLNLFHDIEMGIDSPEREDD